MFSTMTLLGLIGLLVLALFLFGKVVKSFFDVILDEKDEFKKKYHKKED